MSKAIAANRPESKKNGIFSRMQANFLFRLLLSLLCAVSVWLTLNATLVNPPGTSTFQVTLTQLHRNELDTRNLELMTDPIRGAVVISLKGRQEDLDNLKYSDFEAAIDFAHVTDTDISELKVELISKNPENVSVVSIEPAFIPIVVERRVTKTFDIDVQLTGAPAEGFTQTGYTRLPSTKSYTGSESLINQITKVEIEVDISNLAGNAIFHKQCRVLNAAGGVIYRSGWEQVVDISIEISKEVRINAISSGNPPGDYYVRYMTVTPETVFINGTREALESVNSLDTEAVDIRNAEQNISVSQPLIIPKNIRLSNDAAPAATVDVTVSRKQYTMDVPLLKERIEYINSLSEYLYDINDSEIPLMLKGEVDDIADLDSGMISAVINVEGLGPGIHPVRANVSLPAGIEIVNNVMLDVIVTRR